MDIVMYMSTNLRYKGSQHYGFFSLAENVWINVNELAISKMLPSVHHFREVSLQ